LQSFSGNSDGESLGDTGAAIINFAVYDQLGGGSVAGDTFGTGYSGFDTLSEVDTSDQYLYLYDYTSVAGTITPGGVFTISTVVDLALADDEGVVSTTNAFGSDTLDFQQSPPANLGVISPHLVSGTGLIDGLVPAGSTSEIFAFTTNVPPSLVLSPGADGVVGSTAPLPVVPEPGSLALIVVGGAFGVLGIAARRNPRRRRFPVFPPPLAQS
jgi:hypothetical protein